MVAAGGAARCRAPPRRPRLTRRRGWGGRGRRVLDGRHPAREVRHSIHCAGRESGGAVSRLRTEWPPPCEAPVAARAVATPAAVAAGAGREHGDAAGAPRMGRPRTAGGRPTFSPDAAPLCTVRHAAVRAGHKAAVPHLLRLMRAAGPPRPSGRRAKKTRTALRPPIGRRAVPKALAAVAVAEAKANAEEPPRKAADMGEVAGWRDMLRAPSPSHLPLTTFRRLHHLPQPGGRRCPGPQRQSAAVHMELRALARARTPFPKPSSGPPTRAVGVAGVA